MVLDSSGCCVLRRLLPVGRLRAKRLNTVPSFAARGGDFYRFTKHVDGDTEHDEYKAKTIDWIKQGLGFAVAATALYLLSAGLHLDNSVRLALTFVLLTIAQLVVQLFPDWDKAVRKFLGRSRAHT